MKHSINVNPTCRRSRQIIIAITIALLGLTLLLVALAACSPITGTVQQFPIGVTPPVVEEKTPLPIELTSDPLFEHPLMTHDWKAKVVAGVLEYQING